MNARLSLVLLIAALAACSPKGPAGVDKSALDAEIGEAVGDPATCVLIADAKGEQVYRFGTHAGCGRKLPACQGEALRSTEDLLAEVAKAGAFTP
ncbi:MAG TPA: hypothetical protein VIO94_17745, partial [Phenylobacterium sp.]